MLIVPGPTDQAVPSATIVPVASERLAPLAGVFLDESRGTHVRVEVKDGKLHWGAQAAEPLSARRFRLGASGEIVFVTTDRVETTSTLFGTRRNFSRVDSRLPSQAEIQALVGDYRNTDLGTVYRIERKDNAILARVVAGPELEWSAPAISRDIFAAGRDTMRFIRGQGGRGEAFLMSNPRNKDVRFDRMPGS